MGRNPRSGESGAKPLYRHVRDTLRRRIFAGIYASGGKLPTEAQIMREFEVSRVTVRMALRDLHHEGVVRSHQGKGSFVVRTKAEKKLANLLGFAEALEPKGHLIGSRVLNIRTLRADAYLAGLLRLAEGDEVFEFRRARIIDGVPASYDISFFGTELGRRLCEFDLENRDLFVLLENDMGVPIGVADVEFEYAECDSDVAAVLKLEPRSTVVQIERTVYGNRMQPIVFERISERADAFRYSVRASRG